MSGETYSLGDKAIVGTLYADNVVNPSHFTDIIEFKTDITIQSKDEEAAIAIGTGIGAQGRRSVAIGDDAAQSGQGQNSVAIGHRAGARCPRRELCCHRS